VGECKLLLGHQEVNGGGIASPTFEHNVIEQLACEHITSGRMSRSWAEEMEREMEILLEL
jgi:hypothetical protein